MLSMLIHVCLEAFRLLVFVSFSLLLKPLFRFDFLIQLFVNVVCFLAMSRMDTPPSLGWTWVKGLRSQVLLWGLAAVAEVLYFYTFISAGNSACIISHAGMGWLTRLTEVCVIGTTVVIKNRGKLCASYTFRIFGKVEPVHICEILVEL